jgi:hypothetical protein
MELKNYEQKKTLEYGGIGITLFEGCHVHYGGDLALRVLDSANADGSFNPELIGEDPKYSPRIRDVVFGFEDFDFQRETSWIDALHLNYKEYIELGRPSKLLKTRKVFAEALK